MFENIGEIDLSKPVVFLDLCGVVGDTYLLREGNRLLGLSNHVISHPLFMKGDIMYAPTVEVLSKIFAKYDVQVIIVSSWVRSYLSSDDGKIVALKEMLSYPTIMGSLNTGGGTSRGDTIKDFVLERNLSKWVVIDDSYKTMYSDTEFFNNDRVVAPCGRYGMGACEFEHLVCILRGSCGEWTRNHFGLTLPIIEER